MSHDPDHPASRKQREAATPGISTWLTANAGSGKTRVLIDRVARLLLAGVQPQRILCLTYTKAAASEMQNRLFERLGNWAMLEESLLRADLAALGLTQSLNADGMRRARQLFARAIETPGGLKIQTIHSFCAAMLRRFPLEAGVAPHFVEMDERSSAQLREEVVSDLADGPQVELVDALARHLTDEDFADITDELCKHRQHFSRPMTRAAMLGLFDLPSGLVAEDLPGLAFDGTEAALFAAAIPVLAAQSATMKDLARLLQGIDPTAPTKADLEALCGVLLYANESVAKVGTIPTGKAQKALGGWLDPFHAFMHRVAEVRNCERALAAAERSLALHAFAGAFLTDYEARKQSRGWLDFDDLILKAGALLSERELAQWVLYRLDGGIDHILVDEAQDTSPEQWAVIRRLAEEFHAGSGARDVARTVFVVGDKKQSIYSFQGADLRAFDSTRDLFEARLANVGQPLAKLSLDHSFRSSPAVLGVVDATLAGVPGLGEASAHLAFKADLAGRVDLWPFLPKAAAAEDRPWYDPVDIPTDQDSTLVLAREIARHLKQLIESGTQVVTRNGPERLHEGHVLILLQRRALLFDEIIRACKAEGLAIAGSDRLKLGEELAVKDIIALLNFLDVQEDDLSLAAALRSPLLGWSEDRLYRLAQPRGGAFLWEALRGRAEAEGPTLTILNDLRDQADFLRPFELIERLLTRHGGRQRLLARLGPEAEDAIDELLQQALIYEQTEVPSLAGFLAWLGAGDVAVKRQPGAAAREIRVMTVHGAKGLEAPLVILPDTSKRTLSVRETVFRTGQGDAVWKTGASEAPRQISALVAERKQAQQEENMRLLYVAMTRAESWLIVAGAGDAGEEGAGKGWYDLIAQGFASVAHAGNLTAAPLQTPFGEGQRISFGDWPGSVGPQTPGPAEAVPAPVWLDHAAPKAAESPGLLAPSALGGAKALPGEAGSPDEALALLRGKRLHLLLEHLPLWPAADWPSIARDLLCTGEEAAAEADLPDLLEEVGTVLHAPDLRWLFTAEALSEVGITAALAELGGRVVQGAIDRLLILPDRVLAIDYKSNAMVPQRAEDVPEGLLRQMGAYAAALAQIYPDRRIEIAILWTRNAELMLLPPDLVMAALRSTIA